MKYALDELDLAILGLLQADGRASNSWIGRQLDISEGTVRKRIEQLIRQGVMSIAAVLHPRRIGYTVVALIGIKVDAGRLRDVAHEIATMDEVSYAGYSLGPHDLVIQVNFESVDQLGEFVTVRLAGMSGIRGTETTIIPEVIKSMHTWFPPRVPVVPANKDGRSQAAVDESSSATSNSISDT